MATNETDEASALMEAHGQGAAQIVVDQIVAAVRRGDQIEASRRGAVLQAVETALGDVSRRRSVADAEQQSRQREE